MNQLLDNMGTGMPILVVLGLLSLASLTVIVVKLIELWPVLSGEENRTRILRTWQQGKRSEAMRQLGDGAPADRILAFAMKALVAGVRPALLQSEIERRGSSELSTLS